MKNHAFITDGLYTLYPNQYIILVSPPGIGKGTAINFAWSIVRDTAPNYIANMISDRVTAPRILERIATGWNSAIPQVVNGQVLIGGSLDHTCTIYSTELRVLVNASDWMLEFLCESWDRNSYDYDTKNKGSSIIANMCTSLIGGTVPDYIRGIDRDSDISVKGGFTSRCIFVFEDTQSKYLPFPPAIKSNVQSMALISSIKNDLEHIAHNIKGEYTYNAEAKFKFESFLKPLHNANPDDSEPVANFKARIRAHTLKLAMVIAASYGDNYVIDGMIMDGAIFHMKKILTDLEKVFRGSGESEIAYPLARVQTLLERVGMASKPEMIKHLHRHMTVETLDRILYTLQEMGFTTVVTVGKTTYFKHRNGHGP